MSVDKSTGEGIICRDSASHASPSNGEADHAGPCFSPLKKPQTNLQLAQHMVDKGLSLNDTGFDGVVRELDRHGYYRLRGYWLTLENDHSFLPGTTIDGIVSIVSLDQDLAQHLLSCIAPVEVAIRSAISSELACRYGANALHETHAFKVESDFERLQTAIERETSQAVRIKKPLAAHNMNKYGSLPVWAEMENASLGTLSRIFENLADASVANAIARRLGTKRTYLKNWLRYLTHLRNICAHQDRLYNRLFTVQPKLFKEHKGIDNARLFPAFIVLFRMLEPIDEAQAYRARCQLDDVVRRYPGVDLGPVGFPGNWREVLKVRGAANKGARPRGGGKGRPAKDAAALEEAMRLYDSRECSVAEIVERVGISTSTLYKYIHLREE